ncbi:MAG TPA: hypothetical protein VHE14_02000, partial [Solirubrobacteraceae bacterium]|nr:hypothetical protein [Solirubrobacteraceae bacterium]
PEGNVSCAVCGRTLLSGEHSQRYLQAGERREVCDLCQVRAENEGWIRDGAGQVATHGRYERGRTLISRLRPRRESRRRASEPYVESAPANGAEQRGLAPPPQEPRHVHAVPTSSELKLTRALELFNTSEHPRTIAGVARSLGMPAVSVRVLADRPSFVGVTVAWELCWYRYEVDLADESGTVRVSAQGYELAELEPEDQHSNAAADERGVLQFAVA